MNSNLISASLKNSLKNLRIATKQVYKSYRATLTNNKMNFRHLKLVIFNDRCNNMKERVEDNVMTRTFL